MNTDDALLPAGYQGAVWIEDWPLAAAELAGEVEACRPAAVCGARGVLAVNEWARQSGLRVGMARRAAHAACPKAVLLPPAVERDVQRFEPVVRAMDSCVAFARVLEPGLALFPARGPVRDSGSVEGVSAALAEAIAEASGLHAHVGYGEGLLAPVLAAREDRTVPPGKSRAYLAGFELSALVHGIFSSAGRVEAGRVIALLETLGIRQIGDLAELGEAALTSRFGQIGQVLWQLASAGDVVAANAAPGRSDIEVSRAFDPPLHNAEAAAFAARTLAEEVSQRMEARMAKGGRLSIRADLENGEQRQRSWMVEAAGAAGIIDRLRWQLDAWMDGGEIGGAIVRLVISMGELVDAGARPEPLWGGRTVGDDLASRAAVRLQALAGHENVVRAAEVGGRTPGAAVVELEWGEAVPDSRAEEPWPGRIPEPAPAMAAVPAEDVSFLCGSGHELGVSGEGQLVCAGGCCDPVPGFLGGSGVTNWAGPWVVSERWWASDSLRRAYMQVEHESEMGCTGASLVFVEGGTWKREGSYG